MRLLTLAALFSSAVLSTSALPAASTTTSRVPDKTATPGSTLTNAYWLIYVNQARTSLGLGNVSKLTTALVDSYRPYVEGTQQAVTYVNQTSTVAIQDVIVAATNNWKEQGLYSLISSPNAVALGCSATYCPSISYTDGLILPQIDAVARTTFPLLRQRTS
ncbi:hypothetical protein JCM8547_001762 [Rhodosporidiobolus lusitaniae]